MELVSVFYVALFLCIVVIVCLDFFTWRQVSKLKKKGGFDREQVTELFWDLYTQAQVETPPPIVKEEQVQAMVLLALDRLGKLPVSEKPKANGHDPDADEELGTLARYDPRTSARVAEPKPVDVPKVPQVETASKKNKGKHGRPRKEKAK